MITLSRALDRAGIQDRRSRHGYRTLAREMLRADTAYYAAVRLLIPANLQPHVLAAYWFAHTADTVADSGPAAGRLARYDAWAAAARRDLNCRHLTDRDLTNFARCDARMAAFARTVADCGLPASRIERLLDGMRGDAALGGPVDGAPLGADLPDEAAFQRYVDRVSWPFLLLLVGVHPACQSTDTELDFRTLAAGCQRVDFLADLADDVRADRARLPGTPRALAQQVARAREDLGAARLVLHHTPPELLPMMRAFLRMHAVRLGAVERAGAALVHRKVRQPALATARVFAAALKEARHG